MPPPFCLLFSKGFWSPLLGNLPHFSPLYYYYTVSFEKKQGVKRIYSQKSKRKKMMIFVQYAQL